MRTTLTLEADVAQFLKEKAKQDDTSFKQTVNEVLRRGMSPESGREQGEYQVTACDSEFLPGLDLKRLNQLTDELEAEDFIAEGQSK